jgi:hypothetical protein
MTDPVAKALSEIRKKHGLAIFADRAKLKSDLPDHLFPQENYSRELHLLQSAIDQGIVDDVRTNPQSPLSKMDHGRLVQKLVDLAYDHDAADRIVAAIEEGLGKTPTHVPGSGGSAGGVPTPGPAPGPAPSPTPSPGPMCPRCLVGRMVQIGSDWRCVACDYSPTGSPSPGPVYAPGPPAPGPPMPVPPPAAGPARAAASWVILGGAYGLVPGFLVSLVFLVSVEGVALDQLSTAGSTIVELTLTGAFLGFLSASIVAASRGSRSYLQYWELVAVPTLSGVFTGVILWYFAFGLAPQLAEGALLGFILGGITGLLLALSPPLSLAITAGGLVGAIVTWYVGPPYLWILGAIAGLVMGGITMYVVSEAVRMYRAYGWCVVGCALFGFVVTYFLLPTQWYVGPVLPATVAVVAGGMTLLLDGVSPL